MGLSVRLFGLSSWSILLPEALAGVATRAALRAVRRLVRAGGGPIAGVVMALTPAAVLMFRYNNPDALLTLLLVGGGVGARPRRSRRAPAAGRARGGPGRPRLPHQVPPGVPRAPGVRADLAVAAPGSRAGGSAVARRRRDGARRERLVGRRRRAIPAGQRPYIGGSHEQHRARPALGYDGLGRIFGASGGAGRRSGRRRPASAASPDSCGCSTASSAARSLAAAVRARSAWRRAAGRACARAADGPARAAYLLWGSWLARAPRSCSASWPASSIPTTRWPSRRRSRALVGAGVVELWRRASRTRPRRAWSWPARSWRPPRGAWQLLERTPGFVPGLGLGVALRRLSAPAVVSASRRSCPAVASARAALPRPSPRCSPVPLAYARDDGLGRQRRRPVGGAGGRDGGRVRVGGGIGGPGGGDRVRWSRRGAARVSASTRLPSTTSSRTGGGATWLVAV